MLDQSMDNGTSTHVADSRWLLLIRVRSGPLALPDKLGSNSGSAGREGPSSVRHKDPLLYTLKKV